MRIERTKNASKNIATGLGLKLYQMLAPFLMRTAMIHFMGVQYLGLSSLFTSVLHILNLAELGVGSAMVFAMYKPIAEDDTPTICALIRLYRRYYRLIGLIIGVVGMALTPVIPRLISGEVPGDVKVYLLYWLNLGATVLTYWLFAYKNSLLNAHQRRDISSIVTMITTTLQYGAQLVIMIIWKNYYLHLIVALVTQAINNVVTAIIVNKMYPQYKPAGRLSKEETRVINGKIGDLFISKVGGVIVSSADSVVLSAIFGLPVLAVYQNYSFIMMSIIGVVEIMLQSIVAGLGNSFITDTREKIFQDLKKFTFLFIWLIGVLACCLLGLYQPFMKIWVGEKLMLNDSAAICFTLYFLVYTPVRFFNIYKDAAGLWHEDRFRPLISGALNLVLNLWWAKTIGIYGVLLSTVVSLGVVEFPWLLHNIFTVFLPRTYLKPYLKLFVTLALSVGVALGCVWLACYFLAGHQLVVLLLCGVISVIVPNVVFFLLLRKSAQFRPSVQMLDILTKNKLKLEKRLFSKKRS